MKDDRMSPDDALRCYHKETRGTLKIFIGYAPGVGKTYTMLNEANRRMRRGEDILIGYVEAHNRPETDQQINLLDAVPLKHLHHEGKVFSEPDVEAIIRRHPETVLMDELAHTNAPGSKNKKRYQDVEEILEAGIQVISTLNIQHLESLNDVVFQITGVRVRETIPDYLVEHADEVVVVDLTPDALRNRLSRGDVYDLSKVPQALKNFFRKGNLNALRELVLRETAEEVEEDLEDYMKQEGIQDHWPTVERVMVCVSAGPAARRLIRRGARIARRLKCEWTVVTVHCTHIFAKKTSLRDRQMLHNYFRLAEQLGASTVVLQGRSVSESLAAYAAEHHITQMIVGHAHRPLRERILRGSTLTRLLRNSKSIEVHVIPFE